VFLLLTVTQFGGGVRIAHYFFSVLCSIQSQERVFGLFLLFTEGASDLAENPFLPLFEEVLTMEGTMTCEHAFVCEMFSGKVVAGQNVVQLVKSLVLEFPSTAPKPKIPARATQLLEAVTRNGNVSKLASTWKQLALNRVVYHPDSRDDQAKRELNDETLTELVYPHVPPPSEDAVPISAETTKVLRARQVAACGFEPRWIRPAPPRYESVEEVTWMEVDVLAFDVLWDPGLGAEHVPREELRRLLNQACREALEKPQEKQLLERLEMQFSRSSSGKDEELINETTATVTPAKLPALVENNPTVAIELLLKLLSSGNLVTEYLGVLVNMDMTQHSMEVVNQLTTAVDLPAEFIRLYISNCITSCKKIEDKFMQTRLVRFVCVFLQSMFRNKSVDVQDLFVEVQAFCLEFIKIREAAGLFRMLKTGSLMDDDSGAVGDE
jgi:hypothetical protein